MQGARSIFVSTFLASAVAGAFACSSSNGAGPAPAPGSDASAPTADGATSFQADSPSVYVAKVKNVLLGLPPTDDEVAAVRADPGALKTLVAGYLQRPEYAKKMLRFFQLAFQQTQISAVDLADQAYPKQVGINATTIPLLVQNVQQSFARTMLELVAEGHPLTEAATTSTIMMTTALKELYAFLDVWEVDDTGKVTDQFRKANPTLPITVEASAGPIAITDTLDPASPNYMHWYDPDLPTAGAAVAGCTEDPIVYPRSAATLHYLLYGSLDGRKTAAGVSCPPSAGTATAPQLTAADFSDWTMVTLRQPSAGEAVSVFYDLPSLRSAAALVLSIPRVGFFSTPAFFANWQTNISNQMRVTLNQALIVALGSSIDGTDSTQTPGDPPPGLDLAHASSPECRGCHQQLDPLRSIFSANYSWNYHDQLEPTLTAQKGIFSFRGVIQPVATMADFGAALAQHPLFAAAWVEKLCYWADSSACDSSDPEFQRVVSVFRSSGYSWSTLVTELMSSPLTTNTFATATTTGGGEVVAVARRDHLCAALDNRLGFNDVCGLDALTRKQQQALVPSIASGLPSDGYGRGSVAPVLPNDATLFYRAGTENICVALAAQVIDVAAAKQVAGVKLWVSTAPDAALADFVSLVMGLTASDPRSGPATDVLKGHFNAAMLQGESASSALKSAFIAACLAPSAVSMGM